MLMHYPNHHVMLFRTKRSKAVSLVASTLSIAALATILLRWRGPINIWESFYILPAAVGVGMLNSSQFIALSAAVEKSRLATSISLFFLSLQLGQMIGASVSAVLLTSVFRDTLIKKLGSDEKSLQVGTMKQSNLRDVANLYSISSSIVSCVLGELLLLCHSDYSMTCCQVTFVASWRLLVSHLSTISNVIHIQRQHLSYPE